MKRVLKWLLLYPSLLILTLSGVLFIHVWYFKPFRIDLYYNRVFAQFALDNPELLTSMRLLDQYGIDFHADELADASLAKEERQRVWLRENYETFKRYDRSEFTGQELLSYDVWDHFWSSQLEGEPWRYHNFPVNQMFGVQSMLPNFMADQHMVERERDARNYIARLEKFSVKFSQVLEGLRLREQKGVLPPKFTVEKVLLQMRGFIEPKPAEHMLVTSLRQKLEKIEESKLSAEQRKVLLEDAARAVEQHVYPAYREMIAYFESLQPKATSNDGVWRLPDGDAYYAYEVKSNTTTTMSAEQIHQIGLSEVARIGADMDRILREAGYTEGTLGERVTQLSKAPEQLYPDTDAGREQVLKDYQAIIDEISAGLDPYFSVKPKVGVVVKRVPEFSEKTAPGAYYNSPSLDGKRPGTFYANLRNLSEIPRFGMRTLAYHEGVPGHHFQIAIAQDLKGLPIFRRMVPFTAFSEGWALYTERLAWEAGFQKNPLDDLGRLQAEMFRAVRLVVDTGMHHKRWSREQAIQYMREHTGMGEGEVIAEIERYLVNPGQALAYKVGMLKILEQREKARAALGDKFDIREFHDQVLKNGALPMGLLERVIDEYIARKKGA
ncbi:DUF885 domain-containing protein [Hyalangium rubrum]|uniref:DUF885 domain-containing protein n=1 Tax=Hyalangium rubrum TaxID=3103134 RepID=A0ABU5H9S9_9BACT|nr:DUF885 domain-containing protein [Hyalangium sp. s54d21]MDY7228865.1 DUF885 domain-containing protein [Hyalangium sp. s54d21]